jgi:thiamine biosynthesis lipoprotein
MRRHAFRAMGTDVELFGAPAGFDVVEREFERLEAILSRFRPESELSRLNRDGEIDASPVLLEVTRLALAARDETGGRFDPTVHDAVVAAGYDRSFELLDPRPGPPAACGGDVTVDGTTIRLAAGVRLDFGGIARATPSTAPPRSSAPTAPRSSTQAETSPCTAAAGGSASTCRASR